MRKSMPGLIRQAPKSRKRKWPSSAWNPQPFTASGTTPFAPRITRKCDTYFLTDSKYQISEPFDVNTENTANYGAWENLAGANPGTVALVGLCSMDIPNLAKLKERTKGQWLYGG